MKVERSHRLLRRICLLGLVLGCGSSLSMGGGIAGTSSVVGPISELDRIVVAGIAFDTGEAMVTIEGNPAAVSDLRLGMVAVVRGDVDRRRAVGVAETVTVDFLLQGPLDAVDPGASTIAVLEQDVLVDGAVFDPVPLRDLAPGDRVAIAGFLDGDGRVRATRVGAPEDEEIEITGVVRDLDDASRTFRIGRLAVDFTDAVIEGAPGGGLADGLLVEVEADTPALSGRLEAIGVEVIDPSVADEGDGLDVEGFVTRIASATEIVLNETQVVEIGPGTRFENGSRADLVVGANVDVEGVAGAGGVLVAGEVEFLGGR